MGNNCAPDKKKENVEPISDMDRKAVEEAAEQPGPHQKFTDIINQMQTTNEQLREENDALKAKGQPEENTAAVDAQTAQNDKIIAELEAMKATLRAKDATLKQTQLEAALHSRVNEILATESAAKLLCEGQLEKFGKAGKTKAKNKYVEVLLQNGVKTLNGFEPGIIMLNYADSKESSTTIRGKVLEVLEVHNIPAKYKGKTFSVNCMVEGAQKELVFACRDVNTRDQWVNAFTHGFDQIEQEFKSMNEVFSLKIEFSKKKLGIRVEEKVLPRDEEDTPKEDNPDDAKDEVSAPAPAKDDAQDAAAQEAQDDDAKEPEHPCVLVVTAISDETIKKKGLCEQMQLVAINDKTFNGLVYTEQLKILQSTPKPYILSFTGPNYLKVKASTNTYPEILKQLTTEDDENPAKTAFHNIIKGTTFEKELTASEDKRATIRALLMDQQKLTSLLQSVEIKSYDL